MHSTTLDEQDLELLHGLQIAPRVSWAEAARVLGSTPAALAARWTSLRADGMAWVTAHSGGAYRDLTLALVEVDCLPRARAAVIAAVSRDPRIVTVEESTRGRDLLLTVMTRNLADLSGLVLDDLETLPGIVRQRTLVATAVHRDGGRWRLDALAPAQQAAFERSARAAAPRPGVTPPANAW
ncbi:MAG: Lrp/AsnC family transcriptional regulator, partial [Pseudonocardiales bacterium]|nr:Lrp/AsnC family transcriptional regulator [Pseudonocardiales bacterium]